MFVDSFYFSEYIQLKIVNCYFFGHLNLAECEGLCI